MGVMEVDQWDGITELSIVEWGLIENSMEWGLTKDLVEWDLVELARCIINSGMGSSGIG